MGVNIQIFANHQIKGKTFAERIAAFEEKLDTKVQFLPNIPFVKENEPAKTDVPENVLFYFTTEYERAEDYCNKVGEIEFRSNHLYFDALMLLDKTVRMWPSISTKSSHWWQNLCTPGFWVSEKDDVYIHYWKEYQKYQAWFVKKLGGNKVVYIDDAAFDLPMSEFCNGKSMEEVFPELLKIERLFDIDILYNDFGRLWDDDTLRTYGFYEDIE